MVRRTNAPPTPQPATLSPEQMRAATPKLRRRIEELQAIDVSSIRDRNEPRITSIEQKIDDTLVELFGPDSVEYNRYRHAGSLDRASISAYGTPIGEVQRGFAEGIADAVSTFQTIIDLFDEKLQDTAESPSGRAVRAFGDLDLHPEISRAVSKLFRDGHYANAVEDGCKALDGLVKMRSGKWDRSGTELMQEVFSPKGPILRFNGLQTETERSEQQGMMFLYAGAMLAFRNPRAHELIKDDPEQALEYIGFLSMLAKSLDRAQK